MSITHAFTSPKADGTDPTLVQPSNWNAAHVATDALEIEFYQGGSTLAAGVYCDVEIPYACTITAWRLLADQTGSIVIDIWRDSYANFPPTDADAMPGTGKEPTLSSAIKAEDTNVTDWTTDDIAAGDILRFNIDSASTVTRVLLSLRITTT
jgi:hypothetical protein